MGPLDRNAFGTRQICLGLMGMVLFAASDRRATAVMLPGDANEKCGLREEQVDWKRLRLLAQYETTVVPRTNTNASRMIFLEGSRGNSLKGNKRVGRIYLGHVRFEKKPTGEPWHICKVHVEKQYRGRGLGKRLITFLLRRYPKQSFYMYSDWNNPEFNPVISFRCYARAAFSSGFYVLLSYTGNRKSRKEQVSNFDKVKPPSLCDEREWITIGQKELNATMRTGLLPVKNGTAFIPKSMLSKANNFDAETLQPAVESW
eukprot:CAMPEP_0114522982 /NCGR_PEP_ID=MMETSP0109-20121206/21043_1 /TAXON_ID=29199 /ORGANISM="Chlorarachnion reptans, Strain CCCM449" /LENGTH=258 /DNA_ID=CAMNT_0001704257 /DNA_START=100 /DNA_END=873 /DNA_ORIENTATION=+